MEALDPPVTDSTFQIPFRPYAQLKLLHLTTMVNVTEALFIRDMSYDCPIAHPELVPGADAGALQVNNSFVAGTLNAGIDAAWGREAANVHNQPVQLKLRNCGYKRVNTGTVVKLAPVNARFIRSQVL